MKKGSGKVNDSVPMSAEDLAMLSNELTTQSETSTVSSELDDLKKKIESLLAVNEAQAKLIETLEETDGDLTDVKVANISTSASKVRYAISIEEGHDQNDTPDVFVQVNGRSYLIKRGHRAEVPREVLEVLDHAVIDKHIPVTDDRTGMPNGTMTRASRRFPYTNHGLVINEVGERLAA